MKHDELNRIKRVAMIKDVASYGALILFVAAAIYAACTV